MDDPNMHKYGEDHNAEALIERLQARVAELESGLERMAAYADKRNSAALDAESQLDALRNQEPVAPTGS